MGREKGCPHTHRITYVSVHVAGLELLFMNKATHTDNESRLPPTPLLIPLSFFSSCSLSLSHSLPVPTLVIFAEVFARLVNKSRVCCTHCASATAPVSSVSPPSLSSLSSSLLCPLPCHKMLCVVFYINNLLLGSCCPTWAICCHCCCCCCSCCCCVSFHREHTERNKSCI